MGNSYRSFGLDNCIGDHKVVEKKNAKCGIFEIGMSIFLK
jgi:hypothetical protein